MRSPRLLILLWLVGAAAAGAQPAADELQASARHKLELLEVSRAGDEPIPVSDAELAAFLNRGEGELALPEGVSEVEVRLERHRLWLRGMVDLEQMELPEEVASGLGTTLMLLGSRFPVELEGTLESDEGFGRFSVERVQLSAIPLPRDALLSLVANATRSERVPAGVDLDSPFRLPWNVRKVTLRPGQALFEF